MHIGEPFCILGVLGAKVKSQTHGSETMRPSTRDLELWEDHYHMGSRMGATLAYGSGSRGSRVLDSLARVKAIADRLGERVPEPVSIDRTDWEAILVHLVSTRLGDNRCLDCYTYFQSTKAVQCFLGFQGSVEVYQCPNCGGTLTEPIECVAALAENKGG